MIGWKRLYPKFIAHLESLDANVGRLELLLHVQAWLKVSLNQWTPELRKHHGLDKYATLDLERFPIADASMSPGEELRLFRANSPGSMGAFGMFLRELFWEGITVESSVECPCCDRGALRVLEDPVTEDVVLSCDFCPWSQTENGEPWDKTYYLQPASKELVARWKSRNS